MLADELFEGVEIAALRVRDELRFMAWSAHHCLFYTRAPTSVPGRPSSLSGMPVTREDLRNVAIVAHVDHGKTTLVDAMLWQSGAFRANQDVTERVMDSMDLEREKGITILAKNTAVRYGGVKLNIVDTPGHADFGGEVERGLTMVDGVLLLVDASEGPLPQTRFVLRKALEARLPVILVVNKVDRPDARIAEVVDEVYELFLDLDADEEQIEFPIVYTQRAGPAGPSLEPTATSWPTTSSRCCDLLLEHIPAPRLRPRPPAAGARHQPRRLALRRPPRALPRAQRDDPQGPGDRLVPRRRHDRSAPRSASSTSPRRSTASTPTRPGRARSSPSPASPRSRSARRSPTADDPRPLPVITRRRAVAVGHDRHQHLAARRPRRRQAHRAPGARPASTQELVGNVSLRVRDTERPDAWEVQGRGELQLAVLVELMRREGFELTVGQPQVVTREIDGKLHEPVERLTIDVPEDYVGVVTQLLALRKGRMEQMVNHGTGWVRMDYLVPGARPDRLPHRVPHRDARHRASCTTSSTAGSRGPASCARARPARSSPTAAARRRTFALINLQERGTLFVGPGEEVYEGMIVGENARADDLDVNAASEKHLTNIRSSTADVLVRLVPAPPAVARPGARVPARGRVRRGHAGARCACARSCCEDRRVKAARRARAGAAPLARRHAGERGGGRVISNPAL